MPTGILVVNIHGLLREALFPSVVPENLLSVRSFVRKIIDFCEGDLEGASVLLSTDGLRS